MGSELEYEGYWYNVLSELLRAVSAKPTAWQAYSAEARAAAAHQILCLGSNSLPMENKWQAYLLRLVLGCTMITGTKNDVIWLEVVKLASTKQSASGIKFPFGPHVGHFSDCYDQACGVASTLVNALLDIFLERCNGFSLDLLPPTPVMQHIVEYALDPFPEV